MLKEIHVKVQPQRASTERKPETFGSTLLQTKTIFIEASDAATHGKTTMYPFSFSQIQRACVLHSHAASC